MTENIESLVVACENLIDVIHRMIPNQEEALLIDGVDALSDAGVLRRSLNDAHEAIRAAGYDARQADGLPNTIRIDHRLVWPRGEQKLNEIYAAWNPKEAAKKP